MRLLARSRLCISALLLLLTSCATSQDPGKQRIGIVNRDLGAIAVAPTDSTQNQPAKVQTFTKDQRPKKKESFEVNECEIIYKRTDTMHRAMAFLVTGSLPKPFVIRNDTSIDVRIRRTCNHQNFGKGDHHIRTQIDFLIGKAISYRLVRWNYQVNIANSDSMDTIGSAGYITVDGRREVLEGGVITPYVYDRSPLVRDIYFLLHVFSDKVKQCTPYKHRSYEPPRFSRQPYKFEFGP